MNISPVSFGKKIPISNCKVVDKKENKLINATLYEYDCKDLGDYYDVKDLKGRWNFKDMIAEEIYIKFFKSMAGIQKDYIKILKQHSFMLHMIKQKP